MRRPSSSAKYGARANHFYWVGAIPAMLFLALFMTPIYKASRTRSVPEFLKLRFGEGARTFNTLCFAVLMVLVSGITLYAMAIPFGSVFLDVVAKSRQGARSPVAKRPSRLTKPDVIGIISREGRKGRLWAPWAWCLDPSRGPAREVAVFFARGRPLPSPGLAYGGPGKKLRVGRSARAVFRPAALAIALALTGVHVATAAPPDVVPGLTVRSLDGRNLLEWVYPADLDKVRIRYRTSSSWLTCVPPESDAVGFTDIPDQSGMAGGKGSFNHGSLSPLVNGTTYCYTVFAEVPAGSGTFSTNGRSVRGRPFVPGEVAWAFSMGAMSLSAPGLGAGILHAVANDGLLHAMVKAPFVGAGAWPVSWKPYVATGPSQSRPTNVPLAGGDVVYLGSQATSGNNAVGVDAQTGSELWGQPLGKPIQAGPAGMFLAYGGVIDAILLGTHDTGGPNAFHALDPSSLNQLPAPWPYTGDTIPFLNRIGIVSSQAAVDYATRRVYFTSYHYEPTTDSVWCLDLVTEARCASWLPGVTSLLGDIAASPTLRGGRVYVSPISGIHGEVQALNGDDGTVVWTGGAFAPSDGQIKQFIVADPFSQDLYFSTTSTVWSIRDGGGAAIENWRNTSILSPSQPVFFAGTGRVYVGGGDGKLYILDASTGTDAVPPITLGEPDFSAVGAPTVDQAGGYVYVGSDAGVVFAVPIP